ncbi:MAG: hypothetical protein GEU28_05215 [Dehalococcoidia bacterium]|nr:hypothetical protein [Dehalococcoidia bacterium]
MALGQYESLTIDREDQILTITLNRPENLNAVNHSLHGDLARVFPEADADPDSRVIVITGAGRAFSAGGDINEMGKPSLSETIRKGAGVRGEAFRIVDSLLSIEKPVIAMVNGHAIGLGATIALICDVIVANEAAKIGDPHVNVGLVAGDGGAVIWPLLIGVARAKEYLMTGKLITGKEAAQIGLVNHSAPADQLKDVTFEIARALAAQPPFAVRATKAAVNRVLRRQVLELMDICLAWEEMSMKMNDHREATSAFLEKRKPVFTGT